MDQILTRESLENVVWDVVVASLGLDPDAVTTQSRVRISWPVDAGTGSNPGWSKDDDICFIRVTEDATEPFGRLRDSEYAYNSESDDLTEMVSYTLVHNIYLIFYGPHSFDDAERVRVGFFREAQRRILRKNNLYPVPHNQRSVRCPELEEAVWWDRSDITITLYESVWREYREDYFNEVNIQTPHQP